DRAGATELRGVKVEKEFAIPNGRLDLLAEGQSNYAGTLVSWVLAIEAKIDAFEGESQLDKYDHWLDRYAGDRQLLRIFLTAEGRSPENSTNKWRPLSFLELVRILRAPYGALKQTAGFEFLRFYLAG